MKFIIIYILFTSFLFAQQDSNKNLQNPGLNDLINSALKSNLKIEPVELEKKILSTKIEQVNKQPSPMFQFMLDFLPVNFDNAGQYIFRYKQPLKLFGKLDAEENLARLKAHLPAITKKELENELIRSIKQNYFMLSVNEKLSDFNLEFQEILNSITKSIEIKYSTGKGNQYEIMKSNSEFQKLLLEEIDLRNNRSILINNLKTLSNSDLPEDYKTKNIEILLKMPPPELDTTQLITEMKDNNTDYQYLEHMKEENMLEKNVTELERKPDLALETGYRYLSATNLNTLLFSISFDLPFVPWNEKRIDAAVNERILTEKKLNSESRVLEQNLKNDLQNTIIKINSSLEKIRYINTILIPQDEQTFKSALVSYESSSTEYIDILDSYRSLRENHQMLIEEETNYLILISSLEKIIGKQILTIN